MQGMDVDFPLLPSSPPPPTLTLTETEQMQSAVRGQSKEGNERVINQQSLPFVIAWQLTSELFSSLEKRGKIQDPGGEGKLRAVRGKRERERFDFFSLQPSCQQMIHLTFDSGVSDSV